jgi:hypothetical protein
MQSHTPGKRAFITAAVFFIIGGLTHSLAALNGILAEPKTESEAAYRQAAKDFNMTIGPLTPSAWDGTQILSISYSILMIQAGAVNLLIRKPAFAHAFIKPLTTINLIAATALLAVALAYQFPPAVFFSAIIFAAFAASKIQQSKPTPP